MALSDWKNDPGQEAIFHANVWEYKRSDTGEHYFSQNSPYFRASRVRSANSNSPIKPIPGTSTPWRAPTSYQRAITWNEPGHFTVDVVYDPNRTDTYVRDTSVLFNGSAVNEMLPAFNDNSSNVEYDSNIVNRCITECLLKLGDQKASLGANLVTARQTVNLIADNAARLWKALGHLKRGNFLAVPKDLGLWPPVGRSSGGGGSRRRVPGISGLTLEFNYGWRPLMQDIYGAYQAFQDLRPEAMLLTARRTIKDSNNYSRESFAESGRKVTRNTGCNRIHRVQLTARVGDAMLSNASRLGLTNPLSIGWELIPWSFVVDWSLPVGNFLEALMATDGLVFVGGFQSVVGEGESNITFGKSIYPWDFDSIGTHRVRRFGFRRDAFTSFPLPRPYVKSPFSTSHTVNALALLRQLMK